MIEPRVYRAAFVPAVVAFMVAMFSLQDQPPGAPLDLAADVIFEGDAAAAAAEEIVRRAPDRRPGTAGNAATARFVAGELEENGFDVEVDEFTEEDRELRNVVATRTGSERERVVVLAARDADSVPDLAGSAADTAALLEIAEALEGRAPRRTVVLASVDGSAQGDAGARRFLETATDREHIAAVLVLSNVGAGTAGGPATIAWSNDSSRTSIAVERTAGDALRREFDEVRGEDGLAHQVAHLVLPIGVGAQGVLLDGGLDTVRFSGSGLLPAPAGTPIDPDRIGGLGRATLQTLFAIDAAEGLEAGPRSYLIVAGRVLPEWALALLALCLLLPALVAAVDALARARRRRQDVGRWGTWLLAGVMPFAVGLLVALVALLLGLIPDVSDAAPVPAYEPLDSEGGAALGAAAAAVVLCWILLRPVLARWGEAPSDAAAPGAGCVVALAVCLSTVAVWTVNPFAAVALVPAAHLWTLAALGGGPARPRSRLMLVAGGLLLPAAVAIYYAVQLSLGPLEAVWYLFLLVAGGQVGLPMALLGCVLLGSLASLLAILVARFRRDREVGDRPPGAPTPALRGPGGYAGPGSLGGTESALKH